MPRHQVPVQARAHARDRGLRRVRGVTGWVTVLAALGSAGLAGGYAAVLPGVAYSQPARTVTGPAPASTPSGAATVAGRSSGHPAARSWPSRQAAHPARRSPRPLQPPAQPPTPTQAPPVTTSGGS